jgi:hypothetical protein
MVGEDDRVASISRTAMVLGLASPVLVFATSRYLLCQASRVSSGTVGTKPHARRSTGPKQAPMEANELSCNLSSNRDSHISTLTVSLLTLSLNRVGQLRRGSEHGLRV